VGRSAEKSQGGVNEFYGAYREIVVVIVICILYGPLQLVSHATASSFAEHSLDKPTASFVSGQESMM